MSNRSVIVILILGLLFMLFLVSCESAIRFVNKERPPSIFEHSPERYRK
jgi:hypothetical protein